MLSERTLKKFQGIRRCSLNGHKVKDLFQMILNAPALWRQAYCNIYNNKGGMTLGIDGLTIDGYSDERAVNLINLLRENRYVPPPVVRVYIPKPNGKQRPLGKPTTNVKLGQEVWRMILESIYEPVFKDSSHGFRMQRSYHTALQDIKYWTGTKWFIEFDIESFFDNIDHSILMGLLEKKIDDTRFLRVIRKMLKAGYVEDWRYHNTYSGTPQGGIISPILANIYLHELDCYVEQLSSTFNKGKERKRPTEYIRTTLQASRLNKKIEQETDPVVRGKLLDRKKVLQRHTLEIPSRDQHDPKFRRLKYCRYADDFVLGAICPKSEAEEIYRGIKIFLQEELNLTTSPTKSGLKHNTEVIRFLGYDITIQNTDRIVKLIIKGQHCKQRTLKAQITLKVPESKMKNFAEKNRYGNWETGYAIHRPWLMQISDVEIASLYSAEMRGFAQYYALAANFSSLSRLRFLWWQSCLKTMGSKHKMSMQQVATMLNRGPYYAVRERTDKGKIREVKLFRFKDVRREARFDTEVDNPPLTFKYTSGSELSKRMDANKCEYCEREGGYFEIHHVRKLADIKDGKQSWQKLMIARKRQTLVLCVDCHHKLTAGKLPDRRHLLK